MAWYLDMKKKNQEREQAKIAGTIQREARRSKFIALRNTPNPDVLPAMPVPPADCSDTVKKSVSVSVAKRRVAKKGLPPPEITMSEMLLGTGSFGAVYMGLNERTGEMLAVKQITVAKGHSDCEAQMEQLIHEIKLMKALDHPNIVRYVHAGRKENVIMIYMEYMSAGSLSSIIKKFKKLSEALVKVYMRQALKGVEYLHQRNIVHRDIKAENILLNADGVVKLSDFGTSRESNDSSNLLTVTGTPWFMAPEVVKGTGHGTPADIWSLGCTMIQMLTGQVPFHEFASAVTAMYNIASNPEKVLNFIPSTASDEARAVLTWCLQSDPTARPTAKELLAHPFFAEVPEEGEEEDGESAASTSPPPQQQSQSASLADSPPIAQGAGRLLHRRNTPPPDGSGPVALRPQPPSSQPQPAQPQPLRPAAISTKGTAPDPDAVVTAQKVHTPKSYAARLRETTQAQQQGSIAPHIQS